MCGAGNCSVVFRNDRKVNEFRIQIWNNVFVVESDKIKWWRYVLCYRNQKDMRKWDARHRQMRHIAYAFTDIKYLEVCKWAIREVLQSFRQNWYSGFKNMWMVSIYIFLVALKKEETREIIRIPAKYWHWGMRKYSINTKEEILLAVWQKNIIFQHRESTKYYRNSNEDSKTGNKSM